MKNFLFQRKLFFRTRTFELPLRLKILQFQNENAKRRFKKSFNKLNPPQLNTPFFISLK